MGAGRPPLGDRAMTPAEKQRRYRERKFGNKPAKAPVTKSPAKEARIKQLVGEINAGHERYVTALEAENAELRDEVNRLKAKRFEAAFCDDGVLQAEND